MRKKELGAGALLILATVCAAGAVDCDDDPTNLLSPHNCGFDVNVGQWILVSGAPPLTWNGISGDPDPGSAELLTNGTTTGFSSIVDSACFAVVGGTTYGMGARFLPVGASLNTTCTVSVRHHSMTSCGGSPADLSIAPLVLTLNAWTLSTGDVTLPAGAQSARVRVECNRGGSNLFVRLDNVFFGEGLVTPVDLQSFSVD